MRVFKDGEFPQDEQWERIAIYGKNKAGKTRTATSMPRDEKWGKVAYVGVDPNSVQLRSVLHPEGIIRIDPYPEDPAAKWDPLTTFVDLALMDYRAEIDPGIRTIVVDTATQMSRILLHAYADTGVAQQGHRALGMKNTRYYHAQPDKSDFGAAQRTHDFFLQKLWDRPYHLIVLYQETWIEATSGGLDEMVGGPETVGSAQVRNLPSLYDTVLRATVSPSGAPALLTQRMGPWPAGIRMAATGKGAILGGSPVFQLKEDPRHFWEEYDKLVAPIYYNPSIPTDELQEANA